MVEFSHVYRTFAGPVHALVNVSFHVDKGEFVFLVGPSGAGKSTLFNLVTAQDRVTTGRLNVCGKNLDFLENREIPYFRRKIGVVFQNYRLIPNFSVLENVMLPLEILGESKPYSQRSAVSWLNRVGIAEKKDFYPQQLSGGEQQRVAIARALIHKPSLVVADEPTGNLDPAMSTEIFELFKQANAQGTTVILATHDYNLVERNPYRIIRMNEGRIVTV